MTVTGMLTICPTPLGNLGDMTLRAEEALKAADVVCAEDTRVTGKLLAALGIEGKRLERLDENMVSQRAQRIVERVLGGERIAYCTDAGMPGVSDPGLRLVRAARATGAPVEVLPGPTAVTTAYVASGCADNAFYFGGFFPRKDVARKQALQDLSGVKAALIFYESPNRVLDSLRCISDVLPLRQCCVCRELTKVHEEVLCGTASELHEALAARDGIKGEIVLVISGPNDQECQKRNEDMLTLAKERAAELASQGMRPRDVSRHLQSEFGMARNQAYALALDKS